jgi:AbrB family looped-hinge helix DNA binding protein
MGTWFAKVGKRGRFTVPKALRDKCQIRRGDDFDFHAGNGSIFMIRRSDKPTLKFIIVPDSHP